MKCIGAICGDCIGFPMEFNNNKYMNYEPFSMGSHFTDDTVMTIANMKWLLSGELTEERLVKEMTELGNKYWQAGYGESFYNWLSGCNGYKPYNSWGNGSGMRVSPVGWWFDTLEETLEYAGISAKVTHNHIEGIKGAKAIAAAVYLARTGHSKDEIKSFIENRFGYLPFL